ncbi:DNA polymerase III epsilon subunit-like 3'-5' exonuclease [Burkholderiales bacterium JOSHI_001]|nr:DNA polymerase III epsilon subunit-like 3'-5' exonuclease [Burkholderiales bacterium JOSHI_001]
MSTALKGPAPAWTPAGMLERLKREWRLYHLGDPRFKAMYDEPPADEWVSLDCETTGLNTQKDEIIAVGAVLIKGNRVMTSERLELLVKPSKGVSADSVRVHGLRERDVAGGLEPDVAMAQLLSFIGPRPLVGYYLEFDVAMVNRAIFHMTGLGLPQPKHEVSAMYYEYKVRQLPPYQHGGHIDLRFATLMKDLDLPMREAHDAVNDAVMAALAFIKLRHLLG